MKIRKRIQPSSKRIQLPLYSEDGSEVDMQSYYDFYDEQYKKEDLPEDDIDAEFGYLSCEELEEMGLITIPKTTKIIDGETAAFSAIKSGEDW